MTVGSVFFVGVGTPWRNEAGTSSGWPCWRGWGSTSFALRTAEAAGQSEGRAAAHPVARIVPDPNRRSHLSVVKRHCCLLGDEPLAPFAEKCLRHPRSMPFSTAERPTSAAVGAQQFTLLGAQTGQTATESQNASTR